MLIRALRPRRFTLNTQAIRSFSIQIGRKMLFKQSETLSTLRYSDNLLDQAKDIGFRVVRHPFHVEMVQGTLCNKRFEKFIVQDTLYLEGCIKAFERARFRFIDQRELFDLLIAETKLELCKHKEYQTFFKIKNEFNVMNSVNEAYIKFLMHVAEQGELIEIIGALWPCYSIFLEMYHTYIKELEQLTNEHPYYEHVKYYKELLSLQSVEIMERETYKLLAKANSVEIMKLKKAFFRFFYNSLEYEKRFFDSVYEMGEKVINIPRIINSIISIKESLLEMPKGSWTLWDLDDTIWISNVTLLRDVNSHLLREFIAKMEPEKSNIRELVDESYFKCDYELVEDEFIALFEDLKARGIHVLGLTKRYTGYASFRGNRNDLLSEDMTLNQLNRLGISFSSILPENEILLAQGMGRSAAILKNGVIFCSGFDKGVVLKELMNKANELQISLPLQIAFFDNLLENVCEVEERFQKDSQEGISVFAVHYKGADKFSDVDQIDYEAFNSFLGSFSRQQALVLE